MKTIPLSDIDFGPEEEAAVVEVLRSRWLSTGEQTKAFEEELARFASLPHAVAVSNGTAALHLAFAALDLGPGDEVVLPSLTFVATANAARYCGAEPVFADIGSLEDWSINRSTIEEQITSRTRAIAVVHYAGFPCAMDAILALARERDLAVVEDAAHGPGSWFQDQHIGALGDVGCLSFFANKNMTTGEGGAVVTTRQDLAERIRLLRSHGMTSLSWDRHRGHAFQYDVRALGFNYRFDEMRAAIARVQLAKLPGNNERRRVCRDQYLELLAGIDGLEVPFRARQGRFSCHILPVLLPQGSDRVGVMKRLRDRGIQTSVHYPPVHLFETYAAKEHGPLPLTEEVGRRALTLPLYPMLTKDDIQRVVRELEEALCHPRSA